MENETIAKMLRDCIKAQPRGFAAQIAQCTSLTETDLSFFVNETRPISAEKLVALGDWLLTSGYVKYHFVERRWR